MVRISTLSALLSLALTAASSPGHGGWAGWGKPQGPCLSDAQTSAIIDSYASLLIAPGGPNFNATAQALLADDFYVESGSIQFLAQRPLGTPAYPSKQAFLLGQAQTPPLPVIKTLNSFHTCDHIAWRWNASGIGSNKYEIFGIILFKVNPATQQIDSVFSEFNSAAFAADLAPAA